jgi:hypothetical protein
MQITANLLKGIIQLNQFIIKGKTVFMLITKNQLHDQKVS